MSDLTQAKPTPEELEAAEWLVSPMIAHGTEYERQPLIPEIALRVRQLREEWISGGDENAGTGKRRRERNTSPISDAAPPVIPSDPASRAAGAEGATPSTDSLVQSFGKFHLDHSDFAKLGEHARQLERDLTTARAQLAQKEAECRELRENKPKKPKP